MDHGPLKLYTFLARNHQEAKEKAFSVTDISLIDPYVSY